MAEEFTVVPVAHVVGGRAEPTDDYWGGTRSIVRISPDFPADSTEGLAEFSHLEIVFRFHLTDPTDLHPGARRPPPAARAATPTGRPWASSATGTCAA